VVAEISAGLVPTAKIGVGECARVFTGAAIPEGATQVVIQEFARRDGDVVSFSRRDSSLNIRLRGEDARAGDVLLDEGASLGAIELSLLAQLGKTGPLVAPRPRILHVVTGSEIVPAHETPGPGQIRDSNSAMIAALAAGAGAEVATQERAGDDLDVLVETIRKVPGTAWHVLLISGGASVGDYDFGRRAVEELGFTVHFQQLNLRPGKPLIFATRGNQIAFVVPGNPLSHFICWHTVIRPALDVLLLGTLRFDLVELPVGGTKPLPGHPRETWWPARLRWASSGPIAEPLKWQSSGDLTRLAGANALLRIPSNSPPTPPGARLSALLLGIGA
jgi:molybdopterin molybdotransferase